jgi:hypothetical protein
MTIVLPSIIPGMPDDEYHADPVKGGSLSQSGAKTLLTAPALYKWRLTHPVTKHAYDLGHVTHTRILGTGLPAVEIPPDTLSKNGAASTREAKAFIKQTREAGLVPMKRDDLALVDGMRDAVMTNPTASELLSTGDPETSMFAPDPDTGVWLRGRADWLAPGAIVDLKTARTADPDGFRRTAADYGYDIQATWYPRVLELAGGEADVAFFFIVVEVEPPHLVSVIELDTEFLAVGRSRMRRAIDLFKRCRDNDDWPGYGGGGTHLVGPPRWLVDAEDLGGF